MVDAPDRVWWLFPLATTLLTALLAYLDHIWVPRTLVWDVGYVVILGLLAASWLLPRTRHCRIPRLGPGASACVLTLLYGKVITVVAYALGILFWLKNGD
ncbi:hypothetical protein AB0J38_22015 [Streptomyces sp. NPDC050095]|uniref:hypothetical protein n=1 Tax=unclassified Streptomyces TaxID=2593676 RepID=UPI003441AD82